MQLRTYCVTVMDNWTPMRHFWTLKGARKWRERIVNYRKYTYLWKWTGRGWTAVPDLPATEFAPGPNYSAPLYAYPKS